MTTPLLGLSEISEGVVNQATIHNTALRQLEALLVRALSKSTTAPPSAPSSGDSYIVPTGATGVWAGKTDQVAAFIGGGWSYFTPSEGIRLWINDVNAEFVFDGTAWIANGGDSSADAAAAIGAHVAEDDPHVQYQRESEKGAANGYASLGEDGKVPSAQLPASTGVALGSVNVFTKNQSVATVALGSGVSPAIDASLSNNFKITLTANNSLPNPTNLTEGMILNFAISQDGTGGRTLSYGSLFKFAGGTAPVLSVAANAKDFMSCYYDGSVLMCNLNKGFA